MYRYALNICIKIISKRVKCMYNCKISTNWVHQPVPFLLEAAGPINSFIRTILRSGILMHLLFTDHRRNLNFLWKKFDAFTLRFSLEKCTNKCYSSTVRSFTGSSKIEYVFLPQKDEWKSWRFDNLFLKSAHRLKIFSFRWAESRNDKHSTKMDVFY